MTTKPVRKIVLGQFTSPCLPAETEYRVDQLVNTVEPAVGTMLRKQDVERLIARGIQVTIRAGK